MPPAPKPAGQRRRRNVVPAVTKLPAEQPVLVVRGRRPALPGAAGMLPATRRWWATVWSSPMATAWISSDVLALERAALFVELMHQGEANGAMLSELRQLEDRFGLSPLARRRLQWELEQAGGDADSPSVSVAAKGQKARWLNAV